MTLRDQWRLYTQTLLSGGGVRTARAAEVEYSHVKWHGTQKVSCLAHGSADEPYQVSLERHKISCDCEDYVRQSRKYGQHMACKHAIALAAHVWRQIIEKDQRESSANRAA